MIMSMLIHIGFVLSAITSISVSVPYSMYIWDVGWDPDVGCSAEDFLTWDTSSRCFSPVYDTQAHREWLWKSCSLSGREIDTLYLFVHPSILQERDCMDPRVRLLITTLQEGHGTVSNLKVYALFSDGGSDIPEKEHIPNVIWFNSQCASSDAERFDGVSVNNEDYDKGWSEAQKVTFLDNLSQIRVEADKQEPVGSLKTHFSVGWHWGLGEDDDPISVNWNGIQQNIMHHFIDIFHTIDVQTAFVESNVMEDRLFIAGWEYAQSTGKQLYNTVYLNKAIPCQTTFFQFPPGSPNCPSWSHDFEGESAMFAQTDGLMESVPGVLVCLHYFRGPYSSGGHPDWPPHN